jgi:outer membrane autotransporter protein
MQSQHQTILTLPARFTLRCLAVLCPLLIAQQASAQTALANDGEAINLKPGEVISDIAGLGAFGPSVMVALGTGQISGTGTADAPIVISSSQPNVLLIEAEHGVVSLDKAQLTSSAESAFKVIANGGQVTLNNSHITFDATTAGLYAYNKGHIVVSDSEMVVRGENSAGLNVASPGSTLWFTQSSLTQEGKASNALTLDASGIMYLQDSRVTARGEGSNSVLFYGAGLLNVDSSTLSGNVEDFAHAGHGDVHMVSGSVLSGSVDGINRLRLDDSAWNMTANSSLKHLELSQGASVNFAGDDFSTLEIATLAGEGTFVMRSDIANLRADLLRVTDAGGAEGHFQVLLADSGYEPQHPESRLSLINTQGGNAQFELVGGHVDVGAYRYVLVDADNNWVLAGGKNEMAQPSYADSTSSDTNPPATPDTVTQPLLPPESHPEMQPAITPDTHVSPSMPSVTLPQGANALSAGANAALASQTAMYSMAQAEGDMLAQRLQQSENSSSVWVNALNSQYKYDTGASRGFRQYISGVMLGVDTQHRLTASQLTYGLIFGSANAVQNYGAGSVGRITSHSAGIYSRWQHDNGFYVEGSLKYQRFNNKLEINGNVQQHNAGSQQIQGWGANVKLGQKKQFAGGWFIEPQVQLAALAYGGSRYTLDNGLQIEAAASHSLQNRIALDSGKTFALQNGLIMQPFAQLAWVNEMAPEPKIKINQHKFDGGLPGDRHEFAAGLRMALNNVHALSVQANYVKGKHIEQPWSVGIGYQYHF